MATLESTITAVLRDDQGGWALPRALAEYRYTYRHVAGRSRHHAAAITARLEVAAHAPGGIDVSDLCAAYMQRADELDVAAAAHAERFERVEAEARERRTLEQWDALLAEGAETYATPDGATLTRAEVQEQRDMCAEALRAAIGDYLGEA